MEVLKALPLADRNMRDHNVPTCLFFDEANTTSAVSQIKEIMCDRTIGGVFVDMSSLNIIAAVNPYRRLWIFIAIVFSNLYIADSGFRHTDEMIKKLESAGLGYHVQDSDKLETFGDVPLRQLVYRVQPLPPSLIPLVWDFGKLSDSVQKIYIQQMVAKMAETQQRQRGTNPAMALDTVAGSSFRNTIQMEPFRLAVVRIVSATQEFMSKKTV